MIAQTLQENGKSAFGDSPPNWCIDRIRDRLGPIVGGDWGDDPNADVAGVEIPVIRVADIRGLDVVTEKLTIRRVKETKLDGRLIGKHSLILEKSGGGEKTPVGRTVLGRKINFDAICSNFMAKTDCGPTLDSVFAAYLLDAAYYCGLNSPHIQQTTGIQNLRVFDYLNTHVAFPSLPEQHQIVEYLDASCAAIDAALSTKRQQLVTLEKLRKSIIHRAITKGVHPKVPLRNSGVAWFGEIPEHWNCEHLKRFASRIQAGMTPPTNTPEYYSEGTIPWFAPGCFNGDIELHEPRKLINDLARSEGELRIFPSGTVFLVGIGATIGKIGLVPFEASCNQQLVGIVCGHKMLSRFLAYQFKIYEDIIPGIATATTLPIFDQVKTGYLRTLQPPLEEQQSICDYLDNKLSELKEIAKGINDQIATLIAYQKSLIHECVTGKRGIPETDLKHLKEHV